MSDNPRLDSFKREATRAVDMAYQAGQNDDHESMKASNEELAEQIGELELVIEERDKQIAGLRCEIDKWKAEWTDVVQKLTKKINALVTALESAWQHIKYNGAYTKELADEIQSALAATEGKVIDETKN